MFIHSYHFACLTNSTRISQYPIKLYCITVELLHTLYIALLLMFDLVCVSSLFFIVLLF